MNNKENISENFLTTPIKLQRIRKINGSYTVVPITIDEAISKSAKRVKVLPNGKEVFDTTYFEDRLKMLARTEAKKKIEKIEDHEKKPRLFEIIHELCTKRKLEDFVNAKIGKKNK